MFIKINNNLKKLVKVMSNKRFIYFILIILATNVSLMSSRKNQEPQKGSHIKNNIRRSGTDVIRNDATFNRTDNDN